jgi:hypothetical protein
MALHCPLKMYCPVCRTDLEGSSTAAASVITVAIINRSTDRFSLPGANASQTPGGIVTFRCGNCEEKNPIPTSEKLWVEASKNIDDLLPRHPDLAHMEWLPLIRAPDTIKGAYDDVEEQLRQLGATETLVMSRCLFGCDKRRLSFIGATEPRSSIDPLTLAAAKLRYYYNVNYLKNTRMIFSVRLDNTRQLGAPGYGSVAVAIP